MIDYALPVLPAQIRADTPAEIPAQTAAQPYEVLFERGANGRNMLWYMNGGEKPHCVKYWPSDSKNAGKAFPALFHTIDVIVGGLPEDTNVHVRPSNPESAEELGRECAHRKHAEIAGRKITFHF